ncbi:50s ribosomal protein l33 [Stylonychia lemnae]|uniref:50s ribosomal protein l33 n=1 Tax=Stylonychia lemnae TaxID=5949 RepID=A0A078AYS6_STYLE|nr:50s ribosomal protein l33 [Stylonychia lemnae]|eukprot:CDW87590.1 50s ribosomal protein l33 [Stylonychia lemnae]
MAKKKKAQMLFKLVSSAATGFQYIGEKNIKHAARKMMLRKFDPIVNRYVLFTEAKLKK